MAINTVSGALGTASRIGRIVRAQNTIQQQQDSSGGGSVNGSSPTPNKNLSFSQFGANAHLASEASNLAQSAVSSSSSVPNIGDPAYNPTNSIGNLYS